MKDHIEIRELIEQGKLDEATKLCLEFLDKDPDDPIALFRLANIMKDENHPGIAYNLLARGCKLAPDVPEMWLLYGRCHPDTPEHWGRSEFCLRKALKIADKQGRKMPIVWANLAMLNYIRGDMPSAESCVDKALALDSTHENALVTQGFIRLAQGKWDQAWAAYDLLLKTSRRERYCYGDEPEWDGTHGKRVIVSGEQGIGDEIMYASCFNDLIDVSAEVVIDCMPRLKGLFNRSFPGATVYGTRWQKEIQFERDHNPEAHIAMASLPQYFRHRDADFPGTPYLTADPEMRAAFRGMLASISDKPKVGIAWTGGTDRTRGSLRERTLEELTPVLRQDVTWVSLEYHDRSADLAEYRERRGVDIHVFDWITRKGLDYDLTAALVAELDLVITVPTTVSQMAGALGVETWVIVPKYTGWIFAREEYPWAHSVTPFHNPPMKDMEEKLQTWLSIRSQTSRPRLAIG